MESPRSSSTPRSRLAEARLYGTRAARSLRHGGPDRDLTASLPGLSPIGQAACNSIDFKPTLLSPSCLTTLDFSGGQSPSAAIPGWALGLVAGERTMPLSKS